MSHVPVWTTTRPARVTPVDIGHRCTISPSVQLASEPSIKEGMMFTSSRAA